MSEEMNIEKVIYLLDGMKGLNIFSDKCDEAIIFLENEMKKQNEQNDLLTFAYMDGIEEGKKIERETLKTQPTGRTVEEVREYCKTEREKERQNGAIGYPEFCAFGKVINFIDSAPEKKQ